MVIIPTIFRSPYLADCLARVGDALVVSGGTFAENCNRGAAMTTDDVLIFVNDDALVQPGALDLLAARARTYGLAGPKIVYPNGEIACAGVDIGMRDVLTAWNMKEDRQAGPVPALTGACLAVHRYAWLDFDESYRNGYEDVDLCLRAREAGFTCWYEPDAVAVHFESQSGERRWQHVHQNIRLLHDEWGDKWQTLSTS